MPSPLGKRKESQLKQYKVECMAVKGIKVLTVNIFYSRRSVPFPFPLWYGMEWNGMDFLSCIQAVHTIPFGDSLTKQRGQPRGDGHIELAALCPFG